MNVQSNMGRPITEKTRRVRSTVASALKKFGTKDGKKVTLSTTDVAKLARQSKERTIMALRYFEENELITCKGRAAPTGRGQPPKLWQVTDKLAG